MSSQLLICLMMVTTWDVVLVVMASSRFLLQLVVGFIAILGLPAMLLFLSEMRERSTNNCLGKRGLLTQKEKDSGHVFLSFLTVTQALDLPSCKVKKRNR